MTKSKRKALPPKLIIKLGKFVWTTLWHIMMSKLAPRNQAGEYIRPSSEFRNFVSHKEGEVYQPEQGRYKLIVGLSCPWAHRTLVVRALKGLEEAISVTIVSPSPVDGGWVFNSEEAGCRTLAEFYEQAQPDYTGRSTVPVLWDSQTKTIVNNESSEIIVMLNSEFNDFAKNPSLDLYPEEIKDKIDFWNDKIYPAVNNGVYRCGFAQTQAAYNQVCDELFTTLFRFDAVYYGIFKCNRRRIKDYENMRAYVADIYQMNGVASTCDVDSVKQDYYGNLFPLNPGGIIPATPDISYMSLTHGRGL